MIRRAKPEAIKPTLTDVDSAVVWMINKDLRRKLSSQFESIKTWLQVLHAVSIATAREDERERKERAHSLVV